jgi:pimeloyl-ACP methyl ester carboxylesterase
MWLTVIVLAPWALACSASVSITGPRIQAASSVEAPGSGLRPSSCEFFEPQGVETTCYRLVVPENWDDPSGDTIELHVGVFSAGDDPVSTVVYLEGGPGGSALELATLGWSQAWADIAAGHRLVIFDQRGTGQSHPSLQCDEVLAAVYDSLALSGDQENDVALEALEDCFERLRRDGVDLSAYNSVQSAHDVEALRNALGEDPWDVLGVSYGTRLAQTLLREHPEGIRSLVLDGVLPIDASHAGVPTTAARSIGLLIDSCTTDPTCDGLWPDFGRRFWALVDDLDADPVAFEIVDPATGTGHDALWDGSDLLNAVFTMLYDRQTAADVPTLVSQLERRDTSGAALLTSLILAQNEFVSTGMYWAVTCHEEVPHVTEDEYQQGLSGDDTIDATFAAGPASLEDAQAVCGLAATGEADPIENERVTSDKPALVLSGELDPITPPSYGQSVADGLGASHLVLANSGHGALGSECGQSIIKAFLADPGGTVDGACAAGIGPLEWTRDNTEVDLIDVEIATVVGPSISTRLPADWDLIEGGAAVEPGSLLRQGQMAFLSAPTITVDFALELLFSSVTGSSPEPGGTVMADGVAWAVSTGGGSGVFIDVFTAEFGADSVIVLLQSPPGEHDRLRALAEEILKSTRPS